MDPIITVVIPVYNGEKYVARAIKSILNQPESSVAKILLINDGSKDSSGNICDKFSLSHKNVTVIHKENGGVASARNLGIENVDTKYIAFLDCDDWWEPNFLDSNLLEELINQDSADVYQFASQEVDYYYRLKKVFPVANEKNVYDGNSLDRYDWAHPCSFAYRTALLRNHGIKYPKSKIGEDGPFVEMALFCSRSFYKINRIMFSYWKNSNSCVHVTHRMDALKEEYAALRQERTFLAAYGEDLDVDASYVWAIANSFPKLAATCSYQKLSAFMDTHCFSILNARPDIRFRKQLWNRLEFFRKTPRICWMWYQLVIGVPLRFQSILHRIPVFNQIADYLVNRLLRGYIPL